MKDWPDFCEKEVHSEIFFSLIMTPRKIIKEVILEENVVEKNLFRFCQILLHITETPPTKSGLRQENEKLKTWALKMASIIPAHGTCENNEIFFFSSSCYGDKPLSVSQKLFSFARNRFRKMTC